MAQPEWQLIATLGDVNPIDCGGEFVFIDRTGAYAPEIEIWEPRDGIDDDASSVTAWRIMIEPHTHVNGVLSDNPYHPNKPVWYADRLDDVASFMDVETSEIVTALCGREILREHDYRDRKYRADTLARARAYLILAGYFDLGQFDHGPREIKRADAEKILARWETTRTE